MTHYHVTIVHTNDYPAELGIFATPEDAARSIKHYVFCHSELLVDHTLTYYPKFADGGALLTTPCRDTRCERHIHPNEPPF